MRRVALVNMPWALVQEPCLGLSVLQSHLREQADSRVFYFNHTLLNYVSHETYELLAEEWALNDFLFTAVFDKELSESQVGTLKKIYTHLCVRHPDHIRLRSELAFVAWVTEIRKIIEVEYLGECARAIVEFDPQIVGFTCTYDQTLASLALARQLRMDGCEAFFLYGGYALEGSAGLQVLTAFKDEVDAVLLGDGENAITEIVRNHDRPEMLSKVPGLLTHPAQIPSPPEKVDLDTSRIPDFGDYFRSLDEMRARNRVQINCQVIPVEASRGCWWGQKNHCVFCGIDDVTMQYRYKSEGVVVNMLTELSDRHPGKTFRFSDYIFPKVYEKTLLPKLAGFEPRLSLTCESKANTSNELFARYVDAGFVEIQPGIESFSTPLLRKMRKGVSGIQNVLFLMLGAHYKVTVHFNILYGFPFDDRSDYSFMVRRIPLLYHLQPPTSCTHVFSTRFSPLAEQTDGACGNRLKAHERYDVVFSRTFVKVAGFDVGQYCYYFETRVNDDPALQHLYSIVDYQVKYWKKEKSRRDVYLQYDETGSVVDARGQDIKRIVLNALERKILNQCRLRIEGLHRLAEHINEDVAAVKLACDGLVDKRLVWDEDDRFLSLVHG